MLVRLASAEVIYYSLLTSMYRRSIVSLSRLWWTMYGAMYLAIALGMSSAATTRSSRRNTIVAMVSCETAKVLRTIYSFSRGPFRKKKFDLSCVRTMTGNKGKARSLYFGPKSVNRMLLSTEKKRLLEMGKTSPPSFKELLQILGRFVQFGQFYPISDPSVRFCAHPSDFGHFRSILNVFVPFRTLLSDFRCLSSDFGYLLPFPDIFIRFQTLLDRCCEIIRSHASVQLRTNLSDDFWLICWSL